ncbi:DUF2798 domain-containing protein [Companilactobacillus sp.]|uniref:DUF2798 domain-containing protein n=1 Tax=Companilactobacillus sp. TaxID=2767905 RepID=UPI0025C73778|nr:DUF2798 domain-containing protein [Companilactobacillus sp.]MCH4009688.1 DUF2798 domain-containing protein [Companilactobacillus sp.]MCH4052636.1 DUF2798 domain-containing protein [Companilactobacillus sp.]MCH4077630.1 DUF2798 domain-containing protein [Companilactobacillus sp.]MCH4126206.1 DUF2798 domain-containing protein [Companilactobacillus sp.]MCI1311914.1 DUF2798 domain-containing protein [Companilactobacillus sp.]
MPRNLKEEIVFTAIMAGLMVLVMTGYNVAMSQGISSELPMAILSAYPLGLGVAIILDLLIVGPIAKGLAFKYIINDYMKKKTVLIGITISVLMVLGMVTLMSLFGIAVEGKLTQGHVLATYGHTWIFNLIVALPLQLLIVGPIAREVLGRMQKASAKAEEKKQIEEEI